ncbi:MAG: LysR family transcriptional regulator [Gaiellales bacterium]
MAINLQNLGYLIALERERHFGRAARACGVSQPTLSAGIRRLEKEVGFPIVLRGRRYDGLTPEGAKVHSWALQITADVDGLEAEIGAMRSGVGGRLRIGAVPTSLTCVSLLTTPLTSRYRHVGATVLSLTSMQIERGLHDFELDVGITYLDSEPLAGVRTLPLYGERYVLLAQASGRFGGAHEVTWREAAELPLCLLTPDMQNRRIVDSLFAEAGVTVRPGIETNSVSTLFAHVRDGGWSSVMAHAWLHAFEAPAELRAIPLVRPAARRTMGLVWLDRDPEPMLARAIVEVARSLDLESALAVSG